MKPKNLFVTKDGCNKILDFGLAKLKPTTLSGSVEAEAATVKPLTRPCVMMGQCDQLTRSKCAIFGCRPPGLTGRTVPPG